jgi:mRNA-degrading endonuclease YafQ of YafQ-DinJ toxin-antitoxin module
MTPEKLQDLTTKYQSRVSNASHRGARSGEIEKDAWVRYRVTKQKIAFKLS